MKKSFIISLLLALFVIPSVFALTVSTQDAGSVIIKEIGNPAVFNFDVNSQGLDSAEIYNFLGFAVSPRGNFDLVSGNNQIKVKFYPSSDLLQNNGYYDFEYQLKSQNQGLFKDQLRVKFVSLKDVVTISVEPLQTSDNNAVIHVKNTQNAYLESLHLTYSSPFFKETREISLKPFEETSFNVSVSADARKSLRAGQYVVTGNLKLGNVEAALDGTFEYLEQEGIATSEVSEGFIIHKNTITKTNTGNTDSAARLVLNRDIFSRLFTTFSTDPLESQRSGAGVIYAWEKSLAPGESYSVSVTTNYTLPFVLLIIIIVVVAFVRIQQRTSLVVRKNVSFVKTKGGEFALKVTLHARSNKYVENVQLIDTLPASLKLFDKFGKKPDKIDVPTRRLFWNIGNLGAGEERVFSYITYSKIRMVGRFELPSAMAIFSHEGQPQEVLSNRAFFASEITSTED